MPFTLVGNGTIDSTGTFGAPTLSAVGNNAALVFSNPGDIRFTGAGARTLPLQGSSTGDNYVAPRLGNNPIDPSPSTTGLLSLTKSGSGLWILGNDGNDYTGTTSINGGASTSACRRLRSTTTSGGLITVNTRAPLISSASRGSAM